MAFSLSDGSPYPCTSIAFVGRRLVIRCGHFNVTFVRCHGKRVPELYVSRWSSELVAPFCSLLGRNVQLVKGLQAVP